MKQRLLVMNGQRLLQTTPPGSSSFDDAKTVVAGKAGDIKPGIYPLSASVAATKNEQYSGQIIHADKDSIYQKVGTNIVRHKAQDFDKVPDIAATVTVSYNAQGRAEASGASLTQGRGIRR
ncbi:KfrB domain-containing protein [Pseudomonas sp. PDM20]|uniref:KfrB domain-containing protein n=1 Tax=Pseudomonas sp. PDM20 TaxID=2769254 RepID=UPI001786FA74|nr:KfrB domain-containing protein [Pseudomonas sp. PDM20]MBD9686822.1 conjugal transfer protein TraO [Pseudomonas sp. PDM20]